MLSRWYKPLCVGLTFIALIAAVPVWLARWSAFSSRGLVGIDFVAYREIGHRWLETGSMYLPYQFAPYPFDVGGGGTDMTIAAGLYPPIAAPIFAA